MYNSSQLYAGVLKKVVGESTVFKIGRDNREVHVIMGCENGCMNEHRLSALQKELDSLKEKNSTDHEKFFNRIEENREKMVESQSDRQNIREKLEEIGVDVKSIMQTPAKRYETITTSILTGVIGALIGFIMSGILPL